MMAYVLPTPWYLHTKITSFHNQDDSILKMGAVMKKLEPTYEECTVS
jgi:hypothetical protein